MIDIDSVSAVPEAWPTNDPMMPKWAVTVFFQYEDEAKEFINEIMDIHYCVEAP